jgi:predicted nuclease of predicted toxin-antitoxin system
VAKLEFLANMNISPLTVEHLRGRGWNITRVSEVMAKGSKDIDILLYAQKQNKVVIKQDLDFSNLPWH